jgi:hypothetical protein
MNKNLLASLALIGSALAVAAQGTVLVSSVSIGGRPRIVSGLDPSTAVPITGNNWLIDVVARNPANGNAYQSILATPMIPLGASPTASSAGLFSSGTVAIPFIAQGANATMQIRVWDTTTGATFDTATIRGVSPEFVVATAGVGVPPSTPAAWNTTQFNGLFVLVPEPSTLALGALGLAALAGWSWRRR